MKKLLGFLIAIALVFAIAMPSQAAFKDMWAKVYSWDGGVNANGTMKLTEVNSGITFKVLQRNSDTAETLYYPENDAFTSLTNPVTTTNFAAATVCNDKVAFRVDPGETNDTYVDVLVVNTSGGYTTFVEDFTEHVHTIVIDERPNIQHHGVIWFSPSDNAETDTGIDFDYDTMIEHVQVEIVTTDASEDIDVGLLSTGTNGDANGFLAVANTDNAGYELVSLAISGALMDDGTNFDPDGHAIISANAVSLTYTGTAGSDTAAGYIHYFFTRMR